MDGFQQNRAAELPGHGRGLDLTDNIGRESTSVDVKHELIGNDSKEAPNDRQGHGMEQVG